MLVFSLHDTTWSAKRNVGRLCMWKQVAIKPAHGWRGFRAQDIVTGTAHVPATLRDLQRTVHCSCSQVLLTRPLPGQPCDGSVGVRCLCIMSDRDPLLCTMAQLKDLVGTVQCGPHVCKDACYIQPSTWLVGFSEVLRAQKYHYYRHSI